MTEPSPRAAVVTVGEELLSGATVDGNAAWLGRRLGKVGIPVAWRSTVGDRDDDIGEAVRQAVAIADLVVVTGGLGPTRDDRTRPAVAAALGTELVEDPALARALRERYRAAGREPSPGLLRLARRPPEARPLANPVGAAPGMAVPVARDNGTGWVVLLPGVPREMRALFPAVEELIRETFGRRLRPVVSRTLHTTGIPESVLAPRVEAALGGAHPEVEVAYLPDLTGVDLRLTVQRPPGSGEEAARYAAHRLDAAEAALASVLAGHRFDAASGDLVETVAEGLESRGWWLAVAESCTGGLLAQRYTARPGSSATFRGGVVAYANPVKEGLLAVDPAVLERDGAVSEAVARQMASGVAEALDADCGVGITGVAGPGGGTEEKPVGTVWIGWSVPTADGDRRVDARRFVFPGDREGVRIRAAQAALHGLARRLAGEEPGR